MDYKYFRNTEAPHSGNTNRNCRVYIQRLYLERRRWIISRGRAVVFKFVHIYLHNQATCKKFHFLPNNIYVPAS